MKNTVISRCILLTILFCACLILSAQERTDVYKLNWKKEAPIFTLAVGMNIYALAAQANWEPPSEMELLSLNADNLWSIDRSAVDNNSPDAKKISDFILFSSISYPLFTYLTDNCRCEGADVAIMALETMLLTSGITEVAKTWAKRYRPFVYDSGTPLEEKLKVNSRKSFFSGHTSMTAGMTFFVAKVLTDLHPEWKYKGLLLAPAILIPGSIAYFRYKAGRHFPTDVLAGYLVGASIGYLIPSIHKNDRLSLIPTGTNSLLLHYRF